MQPYQTIAKTNATTAAKAANAEAASVMELLVSIRAVVAVS